MKKLIIIPFLFLSLFIYAETYWVTPRGNDANSGTDSSSVSAWLTWGKAFTTAAAGDTVFFRDGVYYHTVTNGAGYTSVNDGSVGSYIHYYNYPGETPILDCSNVTPTSIFNRAINASISYAKFRGLVIRNVLQPNNTVEVVALRTMSISNVTFENCTIYNIGGVAFQPWNPVEVYYINCDAYSCSDPYGNVSGGVPGNRGTGFGMVTTSDQSSTVYYRYCRAWKCGDQGFSMLSVGYVEVDGCWSFNNGILQGGGHGFKYSFNITSAIPLNRKIVNCIAAYNRYSGFTSNDNTYKAIPMVLYNNISYHNGYYAGYDYGWGFIMYNTTSSDALELQRVHRNNISYANAKTAMFVGTNALYTHSNNSWDHSPAVTVTDADFISVDSTGISGARGTNGELPDLSGFLHLAEGSDLIGAGIGVGLIYDADSLLWSQTAPSLGAYEYAAAPPPPPPNYPAVSTVEVYVKSRIASFSGTNLDDGMGTISARGVCWSTSANPTLSDNHTHDGTGTTDYTTTITWLIPNTLYHFRSYITNETGTTFGADISTTTPAYTPNSSGGKVVKSGGKTVIIK